MHYHTYNLFHINECSAEHGQTFSFPTTYAPRILVLIVWCYFSAIVFPTENGKISKWLISVPNKWNAFLFKSIFRWLKKSLCSNFPVPFFFPPPQVKKVAITITEAIWKLTHVRSKHVPQFCQTMLQNKCLKDDKKSDKKYTAGLITPQLFNAFLCYSHIFVSILWRT